MKSMARANKLVALSSVAVVAMALTGCGMSGAGGSAAKGTSGGGLSTTHLSAMGAVHGGQQPVTGATIQLWGVGGAGYGSSATPLLTTTVTTSDGTSVGGNAGNGFNALPAGNFSITGDYSCPSSDLVYLTATGGNPGMAAGTNNSDLALMVSLGSCSFLLAHANTTFLSVNELTTVAAVWPLARFMTSYSAVGAPSTNMAGLMSALGSANKLVDSASGTLPGPALPAGATIPTPELNTLADILAACVNTAGGAADDPSDCGKLLGNARQGTTAPTDTIGAALNIARNPTANIGALFDLVSATSPFQPVLTAAPDNWLVGISYAGAGLNAPVSMAVDGGGNVWLANSGANTISKFDATGAAVSGSGGYTVGGNLNGPSSLAIDLAGNVWVTNKAGNNVVEANSAGVYQGSFTGGAMIASPNSVAIDGLGDVWVANSSSSSVTELNSSGTLVGNYGSGAGVNAPTAIAINAH